MKDILFIGGGPLNGCKVSEFALSVLVASSTDLPELGRLIRIEGSPERERYYLLRGNIAAWCPPVHPNPSMTPFPDYKPGQILDTVQEMMNKAKYARLDDLAEAASIDGDRFMRQVDKAEVSALLASIKGVR